MTTILVVDDEPAILRTVKAGLTARGYSVRTASSGREALIILTSDIPDAVVLDLGLGDMDGVDVCRTVRAWSEVPIIVLSAEGSEARKIVALDEGADDYVTKPFSMPELLARLRVALPIRRVGPRVPWRRVEEAVLSPVAHRTPRRRVALPGLSRVAFRHPRRSAASGRTSTATAQGRGTSTARRSHSGRKGDRW